MSTNEEYKGLNFMDLCIAMIIVFVLLGLMAILFSQIKKFIELPNPKIERSQEEITPTRSKLDPNTFTFKISPASSGESFFITALLYRHYLC